MLDILDLLNITDAAFETVLCNQFETIFCFKLFTNKNHTIEGNMQYLLNTKTKFVGLHHIVNANMF